MRIEGRCFLITGGASGLGAATAQNLTAAGGRVLLADVDESAGNATAGSLGDSARFIRTDVTDPADVQRAVDTAFERFGGLHGVVNAAGIAIAERVVGKTGPHPLESFARVIGINLNGTFNVTRLAAAAMANVAADETGERGVIVNTASVAAFEGQIGQAAYAASKGGIVSLTLPLARVLARFGIKEVGLAPGIFDTPLMAGLPQAARESLGGQVPFPPRLGRPEEYAALVRHVVENQMINGATLRLDGAIRMAPR